MQGKHIAVCYCIITPRASKGVKLLKVIHFVLTSLTGATKASMTKFWLVEQPKKVKTAQRYAK